MEHYEIFWKTILSHDIHSRFRSIKNDHPECELTLESKKFKKKIPSNLKNNPQYVLKKSTLEKISAFYHSHLVKGRALSRQSLKKFVIRRDDETHDEDDEENDDYVLGTRFKYLTQQFIVQLVPTELVQFFTSVERYYSLLGNVILGFTSRITLSNGWTIDTIQNYLDWFKRISHSKTHQSTKSTVLCKCSEYVLSDVGSCLSDGYKDDEFNIEKAFPKFLNEYLPLLSWSSVLELFTNKNILLVVDSLIEYTNVDNFVDNDEQLENSVSQYGFITVVKDRQVFSSFNKFVVKVLSKSKWQQIIEIIVKQTYTDHNYYMANCGLDVLPLYIELMEIKSFHASESVYEFNDNMLYLWKETTLLSDMAPSSMLQRFQFVHFSLFKEVFDACKNPFDIYGWDGDFNWFCNYLECFQSQITIQELFNLVLGSDQLNWDKLLANRKKDTYFANPLRPFIIKKFFPRVSSRSEEDMMTQDLIFFHSKFAPNIFTESFFDPLVEFLLEKHLYRYQFSLHKKRAEILLSFFDFDGLTTEEYFRQFKIRTDLQDFVVTNFYDYRNYASNSNERKLAIYLGFMMAIENYEEPTYDEDLK